MAETPSTAACPKCGTENRATAKFCGSCGAALISELACSFCGSANFPRSRFCDECGRPLHSTESQAEPAPGAAGYPRAFGGDRYTVLRFLGEGGRKRVYLAEDSQLRREVAISTFKSEGLDQKAMARARREAEAMARLSDHPNIVPIYDIGEESGELYLVSQYMAGGSVDAMLPEAAERRLTVAETLRIAADVARALQHAHAHGVIHRDVKPGNVWLSPDGTAKLGDFGLAMAVDASRLTIEGATVGTVAYMSPEQGMGRSADERSDLYSLGALLYELLCGFPPFLGEDAAAVIAQHAGRAPVGPTWHRDDVPRALEQVVLQLLAKSPDDRYEDATATLEALDAISSVATIDGPVEEQVLERLTDGTLFGRDGELAELRAVVDEALSGRGGMGMIAGEEGIGKTRLAEEVKTYAELRGATVLSGRCSETEGAPAYWPWVQVIRSYARSVDVDILRAELGSGTSDVAQIVPDVRDRIPEIADPASLDPEQSRFRLFDSVTNLLLNASRREPMLIALDDIHLADRSSLLLLEFLSRELATSRIFVLTTYRDAELGADHPLVEVQPSLERERGSRHLRLGGLSEPEVKQMIEATAHQTLATREELALSRAIFRESGGNPYFIQEIIRHLIESGGVYQRDGRWISDAKRIEELGIPKEIRDAVSGRLERLSPECRETLAAAAVVGRQFSLPVLESLTELEAAKLMEHVQEGIAGRIVEAVRDEVGGYAFANAAIRDALYEDLPAARRIELHREVGVALEELYESRIEAHLPELAHHFAQAATAGETEKAAEYSWWAGERAAQLSAYDEAVENYKRALVLFGSGDDDPVRRCELLLALGDALWRAGNGPEAEERFLAAADLARELSLPEQYARAVLGYGGAPGGFSVASRTKENLVDMLQTALSLLPERDSLLRARLIARLAVELRLYSTALTESDELSRQAVEMAERLGDVHILLLAKYSRQWAIVGPDDLDEKLAAGEEVIRLARIVEDQEMEFRGHHLRLMVLLQRADIDGVDSEIRACARLAKELRQPYYEWQVALFRAMRALMQGRSEEGMRLADAALATGQRGVGEVAVVNYGAQAFLGKWGEGKLAELKEGGAAFADSYPESAWPAAYTWLLCEIGELDEARRRFDALAADDFEGLRRDSQWLTAVATLSMTVLYVRDPKAAERLYQLLLPYEECLIPVLSGAATLGSAHFFLGHTAHAAGRLDDAIRHYEHGLEVNERTGAVFYWPRSHRRLAEALLEQGKRDLAMEELERGLEQARRLGTTSEAEQIAALRLEGTPIARADLRSSIELVAQSVEEDRPDLRAAASPGGIVTLMFSDIEDSTRLTERLGDRRWIELLKQHNSIVRESVAEHAGYEVKSVGDGFMIAFSSAGKAIRCAIAIQSRLQERQMDDDEVPLKVRIGLHTGEVTREAEDFFGTNVNMAARIGALAGGDQIFISSVLHDLVAGTGEFEFEERGEVELKGLSGKHRIYGVPWRTGSGDRGSADHAAAGDRPA